MRTPIDEHLRAEAVRFAFRFACEDCAHFDEPRSLCSLGYPSAPRRDALDGPNADLETCKDFDLV